MKKTNRFIAMATGFVLTAGMATGISADASSGIPTFPDFNKTFAGFTEITESTGYRNIDENDSFFIKENEDGTAETAFLELFEYNLTWFRLTEDRISNFNEIYSQYADKLNMSEASMSGACFDDSGEKYYAFIMRDYFNDENGKTLKDASAAENKYELIAKMADELYSAGCISEAEYSFRNATVVHGSYDGCTNIMTDGSVTQEGIDKILDSLGVPFVDSWYNEKTDTTRYTCQIELSRFDELKAAVMEEYPDAKLIPRMVYGDGICGLYTCSETVNILEKYTYDTDGDGKVDISDASAVLKAYSEGAAGIYKSAENDKLDVNGDGEVNIEDASYILKYYAESAAGLR